MALQWFMETDMNSDVTCRSGRGGAPLELSTSRITAWAQLQPAATSSLRWAFQPRVWLKLKQVLQGRPGSLIDCYGLIIAASPVQNPGDRCLRAT